MSFDANVLNGFKQPEQSTSSLTNDNQLALYGTADLGDGVARNATLLLNSALATVVTNYSAAGALATSGMALIAGGTGFAMTLAAPTEGCLANILLASISSGSVTVKTAAGVTFDGTNNTATFNAAADQLVIGYSSATRWQIFTNVSVTLSST